MKAKRFNAAGAREPGAGTQAGHPLEKASPEGTHGGGGSDCPHGRSAKVVKVPRKGGERREPPNGLKLSDGGWRRKSRRREKSRPPASVRWSALLGPRPRNLDAGRTDVDSGGGMMGAAAGKGRNGGTDSPERRTCKRSEWEQT